LPFFNALIHHDDADILVDTAWAIAYLTDAGEDEIQMVINSGIVKKLVSLLGHFEIRVCTAALRAVGNIATGTDEQTQIVLDLGALNYMNPLLTHSKVQIAKEAVWFISNITAGNANQIQAVVDAYLLPLIVDLLDRGDFQIQKEAAWAITNVTIMGKPEHIVYLVQLGVIKPLCDLLNIQDNQIIQVVLDGISNILQRSDEQLESICDMIEECGGLDKIEDLQNHESSEIYKIAFNIIEDFFNADEDGRAIVEASQFKFEPTQVVPANGFTFM